MAVCLRLCPPRSRLRLDMVPLRLAQKKVLALVPTSGPLSGQGDPRFRGWIDAGKQILSQKIADRCLQVTDVSPMSPQK